jgi:murein DD-endopeptidase MepM/ murein hydrolase activator NlpD
MIFNKIILSILGCFIVMAATSANAADAPIIHTPKGYGHYCSVSYSDGKTGFVTLTEADSDPCGQILKERPGGTIDRAGIWSVGGMNNVLVRCGGDIRIYHVRGPKATAVAGDDANGKKHCVFTVAPETLAIFSKPYGVRAGEVSADQGVSHAQGFDFDGLFDLPVGNAAPQLHVMDVTMFGQPGGKTTYVDHLGRAHSDAVENHDGHDLPMADGKPLLAVADGIVRAARFRPVSGCKTPEQGEIYIEHRVGTGEYAERFLTYYAHVEDIKVKPGQAVKSGDTVGHSGHSGCASGPHLHFGVSRLTNLTGQRSLTPEFPLSGHGDTAYAGRIEPFGWHAPAHVDPWAWMFIGTFIDGGTGAKITDAGAFSITLWKPG